MALAEGDKSSKIALAEWFLQERDAAISAAVAKAHGEDYELQVVGVKRALLDVTLGLDEDVVEAVLQEIGKYPRGKMGDYLRELAMESNDPIRASSQRAEKLIAQLREYVPEDKRAGFDEDVDFIRWRS